jgi:hypothetical protein
VIAAARELGHSSMIPLIRRGVKRQMPESRELRLCTACG